MKMQWNGFSDILKWIADLQVELVTEFSFSEVINHKVQMEKKKAAAALLGAIAGNREIK